MNKVSNIAQEIGKQPVLGFGNSSGDTSIGIAPFQDRMILLGKILNLPENISAFVIFAFGYLKNKSLQKKSYDENKNHYVK